MSIQFQKYQQVEPFLNTLNQVNQEKDPKRISLKDLSKFLNENSYFITSIKLIPKQVVGLDKALYTLKERLSTNFEKKKVAKVLAIIEGYNLFESIDEPSDILNMLKACKGNLHEINLAEKTELSDKVIRQIPVLFPNLESLSIGLLYGVMPPSFFALKELKNLRRLKIDGFGELEADVMIKKVISQLGSLENLNLENCRGVSNEGVKCLSSLKKLKELTLNNENVTSEKIIELKKAIPGLHVVLVEN